MAFVKIVKNKAYFKRFQVKYRRRREGKTDFKARRGMVTQAKNKYDSPKYRFVCRLTNKKIICQVVSSCIIGDKVIAAASSDELRRYGIKVGFTNYPAAYATGLLLGRRVLQKLGMDTLESMKGITEADGEEYHIEESIVEDERKPFKCILDVGIVRTTTGNRVFGAMKGACDAGLHIPHSTKRFPGYSKDDEGGKYEPAVHKDRIYGVHIANYMKAMLEETPDKYEHHFSQFVKNSIKADDLIDMYKNAHNSIRKDPSKHPKPARKYPVVCVRDGNVVKTSKGSYIRNRKLTSEERKARVYKKMEIIRERLAA